MRYQRGMTRLEFALVSIIFALLIGSFLYAVRYQQAQAEKLSVELNVMSMRTGLLSEIAERLIRGRGEQTADLIGTIHFAFSNRRHLAILANSRKPTSRASGRAPGTLIWVLANWFIA